MRDFNKMLIEELRAKRGKIASGPMAGRPLLILTTSGARTGQSREAVLTFTRDGDRYVVAATAGGSPRNPAWFHNLVARPVAKVEVRGRAFEVRATVVEEAERQRLWSAHVAERPEFAGYPEQTGRVIPVVTLERTDGRA